MLKNIIRLSRKYIKKYVGFMAALAKKVPELWAKSTATNSSVQNHEVAYVPWRFKEFLTHSGKDLLISKIWKLILLISVTLLFNAEEVPQKYQMELIKLKVQHFSPLSPACATFLAELSNPITRQAIELESCSKPYSFIPSMLRICARQIVIHN